MRTGWLLLWVACGGQGEPEPLVEGSEDSGSSSPVATAQTGATASTGDSGGATTPFEVAPPSWSDCGLGTTCADVAVPLDPDDPQGPTILVHLRRLKGLPGRRTLWLVDGGPGDPGTRVVPDLAFFQDFFPDLTVIAADHRGTGGSAPLSCPQAPDGVVGDEGDWVACGESLAASTDLGLFTPEAAARDLALLVPAAADGDVVLWGISYGTHVVQRVLPMAPPGVVGAILDGLVPPDWTFADFDGHMDAVGRAYLAHCDDDAVCGARLGGDAMGFVEQALAGPACGSWDSTFLRVVLGALLLQGDDRAAMPAVAYRYARCSPDDLDALETLVGAPSTLDEQQNELLLANIGTHELWPVKGPSAAEAEAALQEAVVATGAGAWMAQRAEHWPRHEVDRWTLQRAADVDLPVLLLHGGLDPTVTLEATEALRSAYAAGQQVTPPFAGHVTLNFSDCAGAAYLQFVDAPGSPLAPCDDGPFADRFDLPEATAQRLFGRASAWD